MQSAVPHVLATLERTHDPRRIPDVVRWARDAGLAVSLDLIYGTPGESVDDWRASVEAALATGVDHVSAYALVVEAGTRMAVQVRRGELELPDGDDQATKYELADDLFDAAGLHWYEVSNWSRTRETACRHNLAYWRGDDWWGIGPGAHSHVGGVRWWNVKHPRAVRRPARPRPEPGGGSGDRHRRRCAAGAVDAGRAARGRAADGRTCPRMRARPWRASSRTGSWTVRRALGRSDDGGRGVVLTRRGRLLADAVVRSLAG